MNYILLRHCDRDANNTHLSSKGKKRAHHIADHLFSFIQNKGGFIKTVFYYYTQEYGIRCQQSAAPFLFRYNIPISSYDDLDDLNQKIRHHSTPHHQSLVEPYFVIFFTHTNISQFIYQYLKVDSSLKLYWQSDNFCTGIMVEQGSIVQYIPFLLTTQDKDIFHTFSDTHIPFFQRFLYSHVKRLQIPRQVADLLEYVCAQHTEWYYSIRIFGGWIRRFYLKNIHPSQDDIDVHVPFRGTELQTILNSYQQRMLKDDSFSIRTKKRCIDGNILTLYTVRFLKENICMDMTNLIPDNCDFTCNSGYILIHDPRIQFSSPRGENDLIQRFLVPVEKPSRISLDRFFKFLNMGFCLTDSHLVHYLKEALLDDRCLEELSMKERHEFMQLLGMPSIQPSTDILERITIFGGVDFSGYPLSLFEDMNQKLSTYAKIYIGNARGIHWELARNLVIACPTRHLYLVRWNGDTQSLQEDISLIKQFPVFTFIDFDNLCLRTDFLIQPEGQLQDKYYVLKGERGTMIEMLLLQELGIPFENFTESSSSI